MKTEVIDPFVVRITYAHCNDPNCKYCSKKQKTMKYLSENFDQETSKLIPPIVVVQDPQTKEFLVYDGNIRVQFARGNGFPLMAIIITSQADLDEYLSKSPPSWFGIRNFNELLEYMRIYAQYPDPTAERPSELEVKVRKKYYEYMNSRRDQIYGWYDDD
jgi:hypothetical protein